MKPPKLHARGRSPRRLRAGGLRSAFVNLMHALSFCTNGCAKFLEQVFA